MDGVCPICGFHGKTEAFFRSLREFGVCDECAEEEAAEFEDWELPEDYDDFAEYENDVPEDWDGLS